MELYNKGDRVLNIDPRDEPSGYKGEYATVTNVVGDTVYVQYDDGHLGHSDKPWKYYKVISRASNDFVCKSNAFTNEVTKKSTTMLQGIKNFIKNIALSSDEKLLRKYELKNDCGEYSDEAKALVLRYLTAQNESVLIEWAKAYDEEVKAEKE